MTKYKEKRYKTKTIYMIKRESDTFKLKVETSGSVVHRIPMRVKEFL